MWGGPLPTLGGTLIATWWYGSQGKPKVVWGSPLPRTGATSIATCCSGGRVGQVVV